MSDQQELTWWEALELLRADPDARVMDGVAMLRMRDGELECSFGPGDWVRSKANLGELMRDRYKRVPKAPSLRELAGQWRGRYAPNNAYTHITKECADELDAVLREGDYVSLKGVTANELHGVWAGAAGYALGSFDAVLTYLRSRGAK